MRRNEDAHWWYRALHAQVLEELMCLSESGAEPMSILDAGCGTGGLLRRLREALPDVSLTGIDIANAALAHAGEISGVRLEQGSVDAMPFERESFDSVCSMDVLYHRQVDEIKAVAEFRRVLRPGGYLLINLAAFESLRGSHDLCVHTRRRYRRKDVRQLLEMEKFRVLKLYYWNSGLFLPLSLLRRLQRLRRYAKSNADAGSDIHYTPTWINFLLMKWVRLDMSVNRCFPLPFGTSVLAVAQKPE